MGENIYKMVQKKQAKKTVIKSGGAAAKENSLFKKCPRNFRIGGDIQPQRDLTRFVKWPKYIRIQRQKRILMQRLKVPPSMGQFANTVDKSQSANLLKLLSKYSPETRKAKLVVIAHDVDPIEIMCFLPTLCRKKSVTYCFVRGKAALGRLVHQKTATCVALCGVNREDLVDFEKLTTQFNIQFNEDEKMRRTWGGGIMGIKNV